jgi:hypothetical protein
VTDFSPPLPGESQLVYASQTGPSFATNHEMSQLTVAIRTSPGLNEATGMLLIVGPRIFLGIFRGIGLEIGLFYREGLRGQKTAAESLSR